MFRKYAFLFIFLIQLVGSTCQLYSYNGSSIIFVSLENDIPNYIQTAAQQARLFNPESLIVLIASQDAIKNIDSNSFEAKLLFISYESLEKTNEHKKFLAESKLDSQSKVFCDCQRFLYIFDLMSQYNFENVFFLENDNMIYTDLDELLPIFENKYAGIAATFDGEESCVINFLYIKNCKAMQPLANFFNKFAKCKFDDKTMLNTFRKYHSDKIDYLPVIMKEYIDDQNPLVSKRGGKPKQKEKFHKNIEEFDSIFDAIALGTYIENCDTFIVNDKCLFDASKLDFEWQFDEQGRNIPYAIYKNKKCKINNLHIQSKNLSSFSSK